MKQTEDGRRYRVQVYYTKHLVRSQAISNQMFGFSVIHKGMNKQMAQNVKDVQIDRIRKLTKEQGISMRYLCELVGKKPHGTGGIFTIKVWNIAYNKTLCKRHKQSPTGKTRRAGFLGAILPRSFFG